MTRVNFTVASVNLDAFDPNNQPQPIIEWATYLPSRRRTPFKVHKTRGQAVGAFNQVQHGVLYHFENDRWVEVHRSDANHLQQSCLRCQASLFMAGYGVNAAHQYWRGYHTWLKDPGTRRPVQPFQMHTVCRTCWHLNG